MTARGFAQNRQAGLDSMARSFALHGAQSNPPPSMKQLQIAQTSG